MVQARRRYSHLARPSLDPSPRDQVGGLAGLRTTGSSQASVTSTTKPSAKNVEVENAMNVNSYWPDARAGNTADHELLVQPGTVARNGAEIPSHHLLIAGTGRAGTSFLVRYLTALGLDTNLTRNGERAHWDNRANAGLEDQLLPDPSQLPYVVKSPWTYQFIEELLGSGKVRLDAVVLPMRNLVESAASRSTVQMQAMHHDLSWIGTLERTWEEFGHASGGIVYSLNPVDQARLLASAFTTSWSSW